MDSIDINRLQPVRINSYAKDKIIFDFFPDLEKDEDIKYNLQTIGDGVDAQLNCGAWCLYACMLMTKIHESKVDDFKPYCVERRASLRNLIKNDVDCANLSEAEVEGKIDDIINTDIRNCFAHGNFKISYNVHTKKMYFVLTPQRYKYSTPEPIVINKNDIMKLVRNYIIDSQNRYAFLTNDMFKNAFKAHLSDSVKELMLPFQMYNIAAYYLNGGMSKENVLVDEGFYYLIQYVLLSTKITYEQQDYYDIYGYGSNVFDTIALIRNSIAHDNFEFLDDVQNVHYKDKKKDLSESVVESASKLLIVDNQKETVKHLLAEGKHSKESISHLVEEYKKMFDFFFDGTYSFEEIATAWGEENTK